MNTDGWLSNNPTTCWHCDRPLTSRPPAEPICDPCFTALTGIRLDHPSAPSIRLRGLIPADTLAD